MAGSDRLHVVGLTGPAHLAGENGAEGAPQSKRKVTELTPEVADAVVAFLRERRLVYSGNYHQYGPYGIPVLSDGRLVVVGMRTWGELVARATGHGDYTWYAWAVWNSWEESLPWTGSGVALPRPVEPSPDQGGGETGGETDAGNGIKGFNKAVADVFRKWKADYERGDAATAVANAFSIAAMDEFISRLEGDSAGDEGTAGKDIDKVNPAEFASWLMEVLDDMDNPGDLFSVDAGYETYLDIRRQAWQHWETWKNG